jgi:hypothetical protein
MWWYIQYMPMYNTGMTRTQPTEGNTMTQREKQYEQNAKSRLKRVIRLHTTWTGSENTETKLAELLEIAPATEWSTVKKGQWQFKVQGMRAAAMFDLEHGTFQYTMNEDGKIVKHF